MQRTITVTITLTYDNVQNGIELKDAVRNEAQSWVDSGAFGDDGVASVVDQEFIVLVDSKVKVE